MVSTLTGGVVHTHLVKLGSPSISLREIGTALAFPVRLLGKALKRSVHQLNLERCQELARDRDYMVEQAGYEQDAKRRQDLLAAADCYDKAIIASNNHQEGEMQGLINAAAIFRLYAGVRK